MDKYQIVRLILRSAAIATFVLGTITLLAPGFVVKAADGYSGENYHLVRFIGTALIGFGVTNWLYSNFANLTATLPAIYGNLMSLSLAILVDVVGLITGSLSNTTWLILGLHIIFLVAFMKCVLLIKLPSQ